MAKINELRETVANLRGELDKRINAALDLSKKEGVTTDELEAANAETARVRAQMDAAVNALKDAESSSKPAPAPAAGQKEGGMSDSLKAKLKSSEYGRAFVAATRMGLRPDMACPRDEMRVLYDALTEIGGTPEGSDGGFLVPDDVDHQIHELIRDFNPMRDLVTVETVNTNKGSRVMDNSPQLGLTKLDAEITELDEDAENGEGNPMFVQVPYTVSTYGLLLPLSRELLADEVANVFGYIARRFAKKQVITENLLIRTMFNLLTAQNIVPDEGDNAIMQLRRILNKVLDPAISMTATIITNQSGFDFLDSITDAVGNPLMKQDPVSGQYMILKTRPVKMFSDAQLPNRVVTTPGATAGEYYPLFLGDGKQYGTLFERQGLEFTSTDIGAGAFEKNAVVCRGITRLGTARFDTAALARREIFIAG